MTQSMLRLSDFEGGGYAPRLAESVQRLTGSSGQQAQVVIDCSGVGRLPIAFLAAALDLIGKRGSVLRLVGLDGPARMVLDVISGARALVEAHQEVHQEAHQVHAGPHLGERPFTASLQGGDLHLRLARAAPRMPQMGESAALDWVRGIACSRVVIDLCEIDNLNSLLVAWLLQLSHSAAPARVVLTNPSAQSATQLRQLRLDHILAVH